MVAIAIVDNATGVYKMDYKIFCLAKEKGVNLTVNEVDAIERRLAQGKKVHYRGLVFFTNSKGKLFCNKES